MQTYLVGGAVRDGLLGKPVTDRDWVIVGSTPEALLSLGYRQVGADFPVFLHPDSAEEYALARTERKISSGHRGFTTQFSPDVTLEEDLARRDLTINAMAQAEDGTLIDPYGGQQDLQAGILRAVTEAFREDPLRVLRVARFAAQLPGFVLESSTREMMRHMCARDALKELPGERVWQEFLKVLSAPAPERFFDVLEEVGAWSPFFAEFQGKAPFDAEQYVGASRFACWCEKLTEEQLKALAARIKAPNAFRDFALQVHRYGETIRCWQEFPPESVVKAVAACRGFHDAAHLTELLDYLSLAGVDGLGRLQHTVDAINREVKAENFSESGPALGVALFKARSAKIFEAQRER